MAKNEYKEIRGRNFAFVQKLANLPDDWRQIVADKLIPMAYVVHDKDVHDEKPELVGQFSKDSVIDESLIGKPVEPHVHFFVYFSGKRTVSGVVNMFSDLGIAYAERIDCKNAYLAYMLHLRQEGKHRYDYSEMVILNGMKVNFADLSDVDFGDIMNFVKEYNISKFDELLHATQYKEPALFRYTQSHYALVCAYFSSKREE